jgi:hypothetical protein
VSVTDRRPYSRGSAVFHHTPQPRQAWKCNTPRAAHDLHSTLNEMAPRRTASQHRNDADVRGEHNYVSSRVDAPETTAEQIIRQRRAGRYVAGAEGTQDISSHPVARSPRGRSAEAHLGDRVQVSAVQNARNHASSAA